MKPMNSNTLMEKELSQICSFFFVELPCKIFNENGRPAEKVGRHKERDRA